MAKQKTMTKSSVTGKTVSKEYAAGDSEETFVQTITLGQKKYDEACAMLKKLEAPRINGLNAAEHAYKEILQWLLKRGKKPNVS